MSILLEKRVKTCKILSKSTRRLYARSFCKNLCHGYGHLLFGNECRLLPFIQSRFLFIRREHRRSQQSNAIRSFTGLLHLSLANLNSRNYLQNRPANNPFPWSSGANLLLRHNEKSTTKKWPRGHSDFFKIPIPTFSLFLLR